MNNLHRELAPISDAAWALIEEEVIRTFKRHLAGRRVVDVHGPAGTPLSAVGTGHLREIATLGDSIHAHQREVKALVELRIVGVNGPYTALLGADAYTKLAETSDYGYPVLEHVKRLVDDKIIWAPGVPGAVVLTTRGGDFELHIGQDTSIGYLSHTDTAVRLYLQETFTFLLLTTEAAVALAPPAAPKS